MFEKLLNLWARERERKCKEGKEEEDEDYL
jgi:hypothetical protein